METFPHSSAPPLPIPWNWAEGTQIHSQVYIFPLYPNCHFRIGTMGKEFFTCARQSHFTAVPASLASAAALSTHELIGSCQAASSPPWWKSSDCSTKDPKGFSVLIWSLQILGWWDYIVPISQRPKLKIWECFLPPRQWQLSFPVDVAFDNRAGIQDQVCCIINSMFVFSCWAVFLRMCSLKDLLIWKKEWPRGIEEKDGFLFCWFTPQLAATLWTEPG